MLLLRPHHRRHWAAFTYNQQDCCSFFNAAAAAAASTTDSHLVLTKETNSLCVISFIELPVFSFDLGLNGTGVLMNDSQHDVCRFWAFKNLKQTLKITNNSLCFTGGF